METKKFTQHGIFSVIVMLPLFIFSVGMMIISGNREPDVILN